MEQLQKVFVPLKLQIKTNLIDLFNNGMKI